MTQKEFDALPEYSPVLPADLGLGKKWKTQAGGRWFMCEITDEKGFPEIKISEIKLQCSPK